MKRYLPLLTLSLAVACSVAPVPCVPLPTPAQVEWQKMEMNMFCHFGPNTFSGLEWGSGAEPEDLFNPTALDCRQWVRTAKAAGMRGIIITAKHHDGFCLWPNPESAHTVAATGAPDVLQELSDACCEYGLKFGVYISPWDRNDPAYGTPEYNQKYIRTLQSALGGAYGDVFEMWFDGACGEGPTGKRQVYDWDAFRSTVRDLQPGAVMFSDVGPDIRWVGNEKGHACLTNWSLLDTAGFTPGAGAPPVDTLQRGNVKGSAWIPAETDVSIRPGWFWRESETAKLKSVNELLDIYCSSVGRNSLLLLNVPPDQRGRIDSADSLRLMEFRACIDSVFAHNSATRVRASSSMGCRYRPGRVLDGSFDTYWAAAEGDSSPWIELQLDGKHPASYIVLQEYIPLGQRVASFEVDALTTEGWRPVASGTTIGYKRIIKIEPLGTSRLRVRFNSFRASPVIAEAGVY